MSIKNSNNKKDITILTYNILAPKLADLMLNEIFPDQTLVYDKAYMNKTYRWKLISKFLTNKMNLYNGSNLVICLQEVPEEWIDKFKKLFTINNFKFINCQYGNDFNGNMGILIAFPNNFTIEDSCIFHVQ